MTNDSKPLFSTTHPKGRFSWIPFFIKDIYFRFFRRKPSPGALELFDIDKYAKNNYRTAVANEFIFSTEDLASKWGFCDGDILDDLLYELEIHCDATISDDDFDKGKLYKDHEFLLAAVKHFLLPKIKEKVNLITFPSHHNPIRCEEYMTPVKVVIPRKDMIDFLLSYYAKNND